MPKISGLAEHFKCLPTKNKIESYILVIEGSIFLPPLADGHT